MPKIISNDVKLIKHNLRLITQQRQNEAHTTPPQKKLKKLSTIQFNYKSCYY